MAFVSGLNPDFCDLAAKLAPGRAVRAFTIRADVDGVATAQVEVILEDGDMDLVRKIGDAVEPDNVTIVEAKPQ